MQANVEEESGPKKEKGGAQEMVHRKEGGNPLEDPQEPNHPKPNIRSQQKSGNPQVK